MELVIIAVLLVVGLILLVAEGYLFPGISLAGICSTACLIFANVYAYLHLGGMACLVTFLITLVSCGGILLWVFRSKALERAALKEDIDSTVHNTAVDSIRPGDKGIAITRLALIGNAEINGHIVEVKSLDGFIDEKTPIVVQRVLESTVWVLPAKE